MLLQELEGQLLGDLLVRLRAANPASKLGSLDERWAILSQIAEPSLQELEELEADMQADGIGGPNDSFGWQDLLLS